MKCATCGKPIVPCDGLTADLAPLIVMGVPAEGRCGFGGYIHADSRTRRAGSHLCGIGPITAQPRQETSAP